MRRGRMPFSVLTAGLIALVMLADEQAQAACPLALTGPRIDMTAPSGCLTKELIKRQMANPDESIKPAPETAPDAERRLKNLSTWRSENSTKLKNEDVKK